MAPKPSILKDGGPNFHEFLGYKCPADPENPDNGHRQLEEFSETSRDVFHLQDTGDLTVRRKRIGTPIMIKASVFFSFHNH